MIRMKNIEYQISGVHAVQKVEVLFGKPDIQVQAKGPYDTKVCGFLAALSKAVLSDAGARRYPDLVAFGFYIRRPNLAALAKRQERRLRQQGRGLVFHIAPSNVPVNFAYTFLFGLLAGNANLIRISSKPFPQYEIICRIMKQLVRKAEYAWVQDTNAVIRYERDDQAATDYFSAICDARVIWGGDQTIRHIRRSPLNARSIELTFADRYSLAVFSVEAIRSMSDQDLKKLAGDFYQDTYLMDQNACSSPHLIFWSLPEHPQSAKETQSSAAITEKELDQIQERFFLAVSNEAEKYDLENIKVSEKYTILCESAVRYEIKKIRQYTNVLYAVHLEQLPEHLYEMRGKFGVFYNFAFQDISQITERLNSKKIQTITEYGIDKEKLAELIIRQGICGVDRIVSVGKALAIDPVWDGCDVVSMLSRSIVTG